MRTKLVGLAAGLVIAGTSLFAQEIKLTSGRPQLLDCDNTPCLRVDVNAVNAQNEPALVPDGECTVKWNNKELTCLKPRSTAGSGSSAVSDAPRVWFVLFDTSGSMANPLGKETRFRTAKRQLGIIRDSFRDSIDQIAIAPFSSQDVEGRIRSATFETTKAGFDRLVDGLVSPSGDTALYSAVAIAADTLKQKRLPKGARVALIVFTDGMNDLGRTPDPKLLAGADGLHQATQAAKQVAGSVVYTIGFGAPAEGEAALRSLASNDASYFRADNEEGLRSVFRNIEVLARTSIRLLVPLPDRRDQLRAEPIDLQIRIGTLNLETHWVPNALGAVSIEGEATNEELDAFRAAKKPASGLPDYVVRTLVLVSYGTLVLLLWFGLPRLIWPERYIPKPAFQEASPRAGQRRSPSPRPDATMRPPARRPSAPTAHQDGTRNVSPPHGRRDAPPQTRSGGTMRPRDEGDATVFISPPKKPDR